MGKKFIICFGNKLTNIRNYNCEINGNTGVVSIAESCISCDSRSSFCRNCYGTVLEARVRYKNKHNGAIEEAYYFHRDTYIEKEDKIIKNLDATNFINNKMKILSEILPKYSSQGGSVNYPWNSYDRSSTYKTDCKECKKKHSLVGEKSPCKMAMEYCEQNGIYIPYVSEKEISKIKLPENCICREQQQRLVKIY